MRGELVAGSNQSVGLFEIDRLSETAACRSIWNLSSPRDLLRHEMCSEYDSRKLAKRLRAARVRLSPVFIRFARKWLCDENNHFLGFRHLLSVMYGMALAALDQEVRERVSDLGALEPMLCDEMHVCVLLAFDTAHAFAIPSAAKT